MAAQVGGGIRGEIQDEQSKRIMGTLLHFTA
jgi:hypothetical protein